MRMLIVILALWMGLGVADAGSVKTLNDWLGLLPGERSSLVSRIDPKLTVAARYRRVACIDRMADNLPDPWNVTVSDAMALCKGGDN